MSARCLPRRHVLAAAVLLLTALGGPAAHAQPMRYWAPQTLGLGGAGTWSLTASNWSPYASGSPNVLYPKGAWQQNAAATFAGEAGAVTLQGNIQASAVWVQTDGYEFRSNQGALVLGSTGSLGTFTVASQRTARISAPVTGAYEPQSGGSWRLQGGGTLRMEQAVGTVQRILVQGSTLEAGTREALSRSVVSLGGANARLDLTKLSHAELGNLSTSSGTTVSLAQGSLNLNGLTGSSSSFQGIVEGEAGSELVVGGARAVQLSWASDKRSTFGSLHIAAGHVAMSAGPGLQLLSAGASPGGKPTLRVERGSTLSMNGGVQISAAGMAQLEGNARLTVSGGAKLMMHRHGNAPAELRVGHAGATARLDVSGAGSWVQAYDRLLIGNDATPETAGIGEVSLSSGGGLFATTLAFGHAQATLALRQGGKAYVYAFDGSADARPGRLLFEGGTLQVGDGSQQRFDGALTGGTGRFEKIGTGTMTLGEHAASDFGGAVDVRAGRLVTTGQTLARATVTVQPGGVLAGAGPRFAIGALSGAFDLAQTTAAATLELGGNDGSANWSGLILGGATSIVRNNGRGLQTFEGVAGQTFSAPSLSVTDSAARLSRNDFRFTNTMETAVVNASLYASGQTGALTIADGARVSAGTGVRVRNGAILRIEGAGSRLEVLPRNASSGPAKAFIGSEGGGRLAVVDGASFKAGSLLMGRQDEPAAAAALDVGVAARVEVGSLSLQGASSISVDRGQLVAGMLSFVDRAGFVGGFTLSDGADGAPALVLGGERGPNGSFDVYVAGRVVDGTHGPGSLRVVGSGLTTLQRPLEITGRVIVDQGRVAVGSMADAGDTFAGVQLDMNSSGGLQLTALAADSTLRIGALGGSAPLVLNTPARTLELGARRTGSATSAGLDARNQAVVKLGSGDQVFSGNARAGRLDVQAGRVVVDRATLEVQALGIGAQGRLLLSDPAQAGADPAVVRTALKLTPPGGGRSLQSLAGIVDGPAGAGSVGFSSTRSDARVVLTTPGLFTGLLLAEGGLRVSLAGQPMAAGTLVARNGSVISFIDPASGLDKVRFDATGKSLRATTGGSFDYGGTSLVGGMLHGRHAVTGSAALLDGSTLMEGASFSAEASAVLYHVNVLGTVTASAPLTMMGGQIGTGGGLRLSQAALLDNVSNRGHVQVLNGGSLMLASPLLLDGQGGRLTVAPAGRVLGAELRIVGGSLVNNGSVDSALAVGDGGRAEGAGQFGRVAVNDGGVFAPGNSPGVAQTAAAVFGAGGSYEVELQDATGAAGTGFDQWQVGGLASFEAGTAPGAVFTFKLVSLGADGLAGAPLNFDGGQAYQWRVLTAASVQGWEAGEVALDTSAFGTAAPGQFSLAWTTLGGGAQALDIVYAPVPEPHSLALLLGGMGVLGLRRLRRRE